MLTRNIAKMIKESFQTKNVTILRYKDKNISETTDFVAIEEPLQINIHGKATTVTMRTPGDDVALALGFLFTEGLITSYDDIDDVLQVSSNEVNVLPNISIVPESTDRNFYATSSCGVCGKSSVDAIAATSVHMPAATEIVIDPIILTTLQDKLLSVQSAFESTGGIHASALFKNDGTYMYHSEDVGRHNALDKLIGHALMAGRLPLKDHLLLLSGRASFELIQKASMAGIGFVVSVGAPSSLAVEIALKNNITLVGFVKKSGFNIYSASHRIQL
jgi:FdhD protein